MIIPPMCKHACIFVIIIANTDYSCVITYLYMSQYLWPALGKPTFWAQANSWENSIEYN